MTRHTCVRACVYHRLVLYPDQPEVPGSKGMSILGWLRVQASKQHAEPVAWQFFRSTCGLLTLRADPSPSDDWLQEQKRVTLVTLAAVAVFIIVGTINLTGAVNRQQLWCGFAVSLCLNRSTP